MGELPANASEDSTNDNDELNEHTSTAKHTPQAEDENNITASDVNFEAAGDSSMPSGRTYTFVATPGTKETQLLEQVPTSIPTTYEPKPATEISERTGASTAVLNDTCAPAESQTDVLRSSTPPSDLITQWRQAATTIIKHMN